MDRLKIFVSSTQIDLQPERNRAEDVIRELGHECVRAETHVAPGNSSEAVCREMAKTSDVYVGIYGTRYGYRIPSLGVSATELEFREAKQTNPSKILIYVQDAADVEDEQRRFLQDVQDFSGGYFRHTLFRSLEELEDQIRHDLITWATRKVRESLARELEAKALREKVAHMSRVMELYGVPEDVR